MIPLPYIANPLADAVVRRKAGVAEYIDVAGYSRARGFVQHRLASGATPGFDAVLRFIEGGGTDGAPLSPAEAMCLWQIGLIVLPRECPAPFVSCDAAVSRDDYRRSGFAVLPEMVTPEATAILVDHYRSSVAAGKLALGDDQADRYRANNDPAGRVMLSALRETVEQIVGSAVKGSYTYASLYRGEAVLPRHVDRPQCRHTVSLQIDHRPRTPDGRSPWPVQLHLDPDKPPIDCFQTIGGAIMFRGCEIPHGRPALPSDQESWLLLLHYVDADFEGSLD